MRRLAGMGVIRRVQNHDDEGEGDEDRGGEDESAHARSITEYDGEILASDGPRAARGGKGAVCAKKIGRRGSGPSSKASQCGTGASQDRAAGWFTAAFPTARPANVYP